ncbi:hypothetical protein acdb102_41340 [Acidothermaceae bacterium B102]|nr:hypothetical protein acdb102_41340 [Acidothermaceae bacterium B102]
MPTKSVRLLSLSVLLLAATVALAIAAANAFDYASTTRRWPTVYGNVIAQPRGAAAVTFADAQGRSHLMPLKAGDTDDLPVGSVIRVSYHVAADGHTRSEFAVQPGARASALTVLSLLAALGSGVAWWRAAQERSPGAHRVRTVA